MESPTQKSENLNFEHTLRIVYESWEIETLCSRWNLFTNSFVKVSKVEVDYMSHSKEGGVSAERISKSEIDMMGLIDGIANESYVLRLL